MLKKSEIVGLISLRQAAVTESETNYFERGALGKPLDQGFSP